MSISVSCDGCGKRLSVKDEYLGKMLKCPECGVKFMAEAEDDVETTDKGQAIADRLYAQWPAAAGLVLLAGGLALLWFTRDLAGAGMIRRLALGIMGLGIASIGYWGLSSNNQDYNF